MRRLIAILLCALMALSLMVACGGDNVTDSDGYSVVLVIPGYLGDRSFFDSANVGLMRMEAELDGVTTRVVEMGFDSTTYFPTLMDLAESDYDFIISGNDATEMLYEIAPQFPEQLFILFDSGMPDAEVPPNVFSLEYAIGGASYLAGALAAMITTSDMELANPEPIIGVLGGMDVPGINEFIIAYIQGALYINPDVKVITSFSGVFNDPVLGLEIGLLQFEAGADVSFNVAGQTGMGLINSAFESNRYIIGVDSDQAMLFAETDPDNAYKIVTSVLKNLDVGIFEAVRDAINGDLEFGQHRIRTIVDGGVGIARNEFYEMVPQEFRDRISQIEEDIMAGNIEIMSAFDMTQEEIVDFRNSVAP